jgi:hypothetical protein
LSEPHHALGKQFADLMLPALYVSVVGKTPGNLLEQVHLLGNFPEKQTSKVSGDPLGAELGFDAAIAEAFK